MTCRPRDAKTIARAFIDKDMPIPDALYGTDYDEMVGAIIRLLRARERELIRVVAYEAKFVDVDSVDERERGYADGRTAAADAIRAHVRPRRKE